MCNRLRSVPHGGILDVWVPSNNIVRPGPLRAKQINNGGISILR